MQSGFPDLVPIEILPLMSVGTTMWKQQESPHQTMNHKDCRVFFLARAGLSDSGCCARSLQEAKNNKKKLNKYKLRQANRSQKR